MAAGTVLVSSLTTGTPVAVDVVGGVDYQRVKLVGGSASDTVGVPATTADPGAGEAGLVVRQVPGVSVLAQVTGAVGISSMPAITGNVGVSGAVSISAMPAVTGNVGVSGAVSISAMPAVTGNVGVSGVVSVSGLVGVSVTISGMVVTNTGTQAVGGTVNVSGVTPVLTQQTNVATGIPVWLVGGQTATGVPVMVSVTTGAVVTLAGVAGVTNTGTQVVTLATAGIVSIIPGVSVTISGLVVTNTGTQVVSLATGGIVTLVGIVPVTVSGITAAATQQTKLVAGLPVWIAGGQDSISGVPLIVTGTGLIVTNTGTQVVSLATGGVVTMVGTVPASIAGITVAATQQTFHVAGLPVWLAGGQDSVSGIPVIVTGTGLIMTNTGTQPVTVSGITAAATQQTFHAAGLPVWIIGGQDSVSGFPVLVSVSAEPAVNTQVATAGALCWLAPTQTLAPVSIIRPGGQVLMIATNTSVLATSTSQMALLSVLFDAYTTTQLVSGYTVRAPLAFTGVTIVYSATSVTATSIGMALWVTTSGVSITSGALPIWSTVFAGTTGNAVVTTCNFPNTILLPAGGVMGFAVYRVTSATTTANYALTMTGQYAT